MTTTFRVTTGYYLEECGLVTRHGRTRTQQFFCDFIYKFCPDDDFEVYPKKTRGPG